MNLTRRYGIIPISKLSDFLERKIYYWLVLGIIYSLLFWPLLNSLCIIGLFAFWLFFSQKKLPEAGLKRVCLFVFPLLYLISVAGITYTVNLDEGLFRLQQKLPILIFPLIFGTTTHLDQKFMRGILLHFVVATALACSSSIIVNGWHYLQSGDSTFFAMPRLFLYRDGYSYQIALFCLTAILICFMILKEKKENKKLLLIFAIILFSIFILLLSIRLVIALWLALIVLNVFLLIKNIIARLTIALVLIGCVVLAIIVIPPLRSQWTELVNLKQERIPLDQDASLGRAWGGGAIRIAIWQSSAELRSEHWLTGVGTGDIQDSLQQAYWNHQFFFASNYNKYNAHNQYLQLLIGHGISGVAILLACIILPVFMVAKNKTGLLYLSMIFLFATVCFTEVILDINKGVVWYSFFNSIFAFSIIDHKSDTNLTTS